MRNYQSHYSDQDVLLDKNGYRYNVGVVVADKYLNRILLAKRIKNNGWQFPQGGIMRNEGPMEAMYREMREEIGLDSSDVELVSFIKTWLYYELPCNLIKKDTYPVCVGQKQRWFLLKLLASDDSIKLDTYEEPEFIEWNWVSYWDPLKKVVFFKKGVYQRVLREFEKFFDH